jgi:hypothetical protein
VLVFHCKSCDYTEDADPSAWCVYRNEVHHTSKERTVILQVRPMRATHPPPAHILAGIGGFAPVAACRRDKRQFSVLHLALWAAAAELAWQHAQQMRLLSSGIMCHEGRACCCSVYLCSRS